MSGVRVFWAILVRFAGAVVFISLAFCALVYEHKGFRRYHHAHVSAGLVAIGIVIIPSIAYPLPIYCLSIAYPFICPAEGERRCEHSMTPRPLPAMGMSGIS